MADDNQEIFEAVEHPFQIDLLRRRIKTRNNIYGGTPTRPFLKISPDFLPSGVVEAASPLTQVLGTAAATNTVVYTIAQNMISSNSDQESVGNCFRVSFAGVYTTDDASAVCTQSVFIGAAASPTFLHTVDTPAGTVTNAPWIIEWNVIFTAIGSSGTIESYGKAMFNSQETSGVTASATTVDTTVPVVLGWRANWKATGSAGDSITLRMVIVELLN